MSYRPTERTSHGPEPPVRTFVRRSHAVWAQRKRGSFVLERNASATRRDERARRTGWWESNGLPRSVRFSRPVYARANTCFCFLLLFGKSLPDRDEPKGGHGTFPATFDLRSANQL